MRNKVESKDYEFNASLGYLARPILKSKNKQTSATKHLSLFYTFSMPWAQTWVLGVLQIMLYTSCKTYTEYHSASTARRQPDNC